MSPEWHEEAAPAYGRASHPNRNLVQQHQRQQHLQHVGRQSQHHFVPTAFRVLGPKLPIKCVDAAAEVALVDRVVAHVQRWTSTSPWNLTTSAISPLRGANTWHVKEFLDRNGDRLIRAGQRILVVPQVCTMRTHQRFIGARSKPNRLLREECGHMLCFLYKLTKSFACISVFSDQPFSLSTAASKRKHSPLVPCYTSG